MLVSVALMVLDHKFEKLSDVREQLSVMTAPLHYIAALPVDFVDKFSGFFEASESLQQKNLDLERQNLLLNARLQRMAALETENLRLRDLLASSSKLQDQILIAELIAVDLDPFQHQVVINKGSLDDVYPGQAVLDANAVLGQVIHVSPISATVLMITDAGHALPVQVNRNGLRTVAFGTGDLNQLELRHLPANADIQVNDLLITSGLGGRFPTNYPVGLVTHVERQPGAPFLTVYANPTAHLERAREVLLVVPRDTLRASNTPEMPEDGSGTQDTHTESAGGVRDD